MNSLDATARQSVDTNTAEERISVASLVIDALRTAPNQCGSTLYVSGRINVGFDEVRATLVALTHGDTPAVVVDYSSGTRAYRLVGAAQLMPEHRHALMVLNHHGGTVRALNLGADLQASMWWLAARGFVDINDGNVWPSHAGKKAIVSILKNHAADTQTA